MFNTNNNKLDEKYETLDKLFEESLSNFVWGHTGDSSMHELK